MFEAIKRTLSKYNKKKNLAKIRLGICAMDKKAKSKPMKEILKRLPEELFEIIIFGDECILNLPIESWPVVDCLIAFYSTRFPSQKALDYVKLRKPFMINDLEMDAVLKDRRKVYQILQQEGIDVPFHVLCERDDPNVVNVIEEFDEYIVVNGVQVNKPLVEKPVDAENHNIYIYYPMSAGGGSKRLFRKVDDRSSEFYPHMNDVRREGSYIYEQFVVTQGTDVKVYTVGPDYGHAEARKSPVVDGRVNRDKDGLEVRFPVILSPTEKDIARKIVRAFRQTVCGFDILRVHGKSYCCDVNGFSFVKNSRKYYDDASQVLVEIMISTVRPDLHLTLSTRAPLVRPRPQLAVARWDFREISSLSGRRDKESMAAAIASATASTNNNTMSSSGGNAKDGNNNNNTTINDSNNIMPVVQVVAATPVTATTTTATSSLSFATAGFVNMMRRNSVDDVTTSLRGGTVSGGVNSTSASPSIEALENSITIANNTINNSSSGGGGVIMSERLSSSQQPSSAMMANNASGVTSSPSLPNFTNLAHPTPHHHHLPHPTTTTSSSHTPFAVTPNASVPSLHGISGNAYNDTASEYGGTNNRMSPTASLNSLELDKEELRCVIGVIRHGDRTPKQKMKLVISEARYLEYFHHYSASAKKDLKVKSKSALLRFLEVTREVISDPTMMKENKVLLRKLKQIKDVLERWEISGINRKLQMKPAKWEEVVIDSNNSSNNTTCAMMGRDRGVSSSPFLVRQGTTSSDPAMYIAATTTNCFTTTGNVITSISSSNAATTNNNNNNNNNNKANDGSANNNTGTNTTAVSTTTQQQPQQTQLRATEVLLILKWGGDLTPLGRKQAEELGESFRYMMYPDTGGGMLRLHATYRHDLKIKASDEGRVMKTAAAFAKGLLELEGPLTPILASLVTVEEKSTQMLDREGNRDIKEEMDRCKEHLNLLQFDKELTEDFVNIIAPDCNSAQKAAILRLGNPVKSLQKMHSLIGSLCDQLHELIKNTTPIEQEPQFKGVLHDSGVTIAGITAGGTGTGTATPIKIANSNNSTNNTTNSAMNSTHPSRPASARKLQLGDSHDEELIMIQQQQIINDVVNNAVDVAGGRTAVAVAVVQVPLSSPSSAISSTKSQQLVVDGVVMTGTDTNITANNNTISSTSTTSGVDVDGTKVSDVKVVVSSNIAGSNSDHLKDDGSNSTWRSTSPPPSEVVSSPHGTAATVLVFDSDSTTILQPPQILSPLSTSLCQSSSSQQSEIPPPSPVSPVSARTALFLMAESLSEMPVLPRQDSIGLDIKDLDTIATFVMHTNVYDATNNITNDFMDTTQELQGENNNNTVCTLAHESKENNNNNSNHSNNHNNNNHNGTYNSNYNSASNSNNNSHLNINEDKPFSLADLDIPSSSSMSASGSGIVSMNNSFHGGNNSSSHYPTATGMSASVSAMSGGSGTGGSMSNIHMVTSNTKLPPRLYLDETLQLMADRWEKLFKDFYNAKLGLYDLSKVPDIYDAIRYEVLHNCHLKLDGMKELYELSMLFENTVVPQEYGIDRNDKRKIGAMMCHFLLEKIKYDLMTSSCEDAHMSDMRFQLDETHAEDLAINSFGRSVRTRLYFTSESHLHTLLNVLRYAGDDVGEPYAIDKVGIDKLDSISELSYLTQVLIRLFEDREDPTKFRCEISFSPGAVCDPFTNKSSELCPTILLNKSIPVETLIACLDSAINVGYGLDSSSESQDHLSTVANYNTALLGNNNNTTTSTITASATATASSIQQAKS